MTEQNASPVASPGSRKRTLPKSSDNPKSTDTAPLSTLPTSATLTMSGPSGRLGDSSSRRGGSSVRRHAKSIIFSEDSQRAPRGSIRPKKLSSKPTMSKSKTRNQSFKSLPNSEKIHYEKTYKKHLSKKKRSCCLRVCKWRGVTA